MIEECVICWHKAHPKKVCKVLEDDPMDMDFEEICGCNESVVSEDAYSWRNIEEEISSPDPTDYRRN